MKSQPSRWFAGMVLWTFVQAPGIAGTHFEFSESKPVRLVWDAVPGRVYHLRESADLHTWGPVTGFPKTAAGASLEHGFAAGDHGYFRIVALTGGGGWQACEVPPLSGSQRFQLADISATDSSTLWIGGNISPDGDGVVLKSTDGGLTWNVLFRSGGFGPVNELQMVTPDVGFIAGGGLRRTSDGGVTWQFEQGNLPIPPGTWHNIGPDGYVYGMWAVDAQHIWTAGYDGYIAGVIHHRVPERPQGDPENLNAPWWLEWAQSYHGMYGIAAADASTAWAVGWQGYIWKTTDGQNWAQQTSNTAAALQDIVALSPLTAWAVGDGGTIVKTIDGGTTWTPQASGTTENLTRIAAPDAMNAWAVGTAGTVLHTTDGGTSWLRQYSGTAANLYGVTAVSPTLAWAVGADGTILRTSDAGSGSWTGPTLAWIAPAVVGSYSNPPLTATLGGSEFRGGNLSVTIGENVGEGTSLVDASTITTRLPYLAPGTHDVTVANEDGKSATLSRAVTALPEPIVVRHAPLRGPVAGGFPVVIEGFNLQSVVVATLQGGEDEAMEVTEVSPTQVTVSIPASATRTDGKRSIWLRSRENQSAVVRDLVLEPVGGAPLAIGSITPGIGPTQTLITLNGSGFNESTVVWMNGFSPTILTRSATQLTFRAVGSPGVVDLDIANEGGDVRISPGFWLTSGTAPTLTQVSPSGGPAIGGNTVSLTGSGFQAGDSVTFGGYPAEITARTATTLTLRVPAHPAGVVAIHLMPDGLTRAAATLASAYTFQ